MSFKLANFLPTAEGVDLLPVAPLTVYENTKTGDEKPSIYCAHARNPSGTNLPPQKKNKINKSEDAPDICHSLPTLWSTIWWQRSYVLADSQSIFRAAATDRRSQREGRNASCLCYVFSCFSNATPSSIMAPLWRAAAWCLSKEGNFQSFTCTLKWLRPCAESASQSQCVLDIFKLSARAQRRCRLSANHCQVYGSAFRASCQLTL